MVKRPIFRIVLLTVLAIMASSLFVACQGEATPAAAPEAATEAPATEAPAIEASATETPAEEEAPPAAEAADEAEGAEDASGAEASPASAQSAAPLTLRFVASGTEARFLIDEVLMGQDKTVVGLTSLVEGELTVDPNDAASVQVGEIRIDARDLTTDDDRRTNRLRNDILKSSQDAYRYITFRPTSIDGLPASAAPGDAFTFQVTGDLTIIDTTLPVTFDMTVTAVDATTVQGSGSAVIRYADFGIDIPRVPVVASVEDDVTLEIDFTAQAGG
jgi:polyisoprenoid-binding protein YceI